MNHDEWINIDKVHVPRLIFTMPIDKKESDEWETPDELYDAICKMTGVTPTLDVCATYYNHKCDKYIPNDHYDGALNKEIPEHQWTEDSWCNAPGKKITKFVKRAVDQWIRYNINILMLIPVNTITNKSFQIVWDFMKAGNIDIFPLFGIRPHFLWKGEESEYGSRNGYIVVHFKKW